MMEIEQKESTQVNDPTPSISAVRGCSILQGRPNIRKPQSLGALLHQLETTEADLLIEGTITLQVDVSIERSHQYQRDETTGKARLALGKGWFVSLGIPSRATLSADASPFGDGEIQMQYDLSYASEEGGMITLGDAIPALSIDTEAKIWTIRQAP